MYLRPSSIAPTRSTLSTADKRLQLRGQRGRGFTLTHSPLQGSLRRSATALRTRREWKRNHNCFSGEEEESASHSRVRILQHAMVRSPTSKAKLLTTFLQAVVNPSNQCSTGSLQGVVRQRRIDDRLRPYVPLACMCTSFLQKKSRHYNVLVGKYHQLGSVGTHVVPAWECTISAAIPLE